MIKTMLQVIASFLPPPFNVWTHRLYGAKIGKHVCIYPGVLILAKNVNIGSESRIRFGTLVNARSFKIGRKCLVGYFVFIKGISDFIAGDACVIGVKAMINCECPVRLGNYCGIGPSSSLFTHGSMLPVTDGYKTTFSPIELKDKVWITLNNIIGPGVTVGKGSVSMPGTVLLQNVGEKRLVAGGPAKFTDIPNITLRNRTKDLEKFANKILEEYCEWSNTYAGTNWHMAEGSLHITERWKKMKISVNQDGDIVLLTRKGDSRSGMYLNINDLTTDRRRHRAKNKFEDYIRLYYGLTFL